MQVKPHDNQQNNSPHTRGLVLTTSTRFHPRVVRPNYGDTQIRSNMNAWIVRTTRGKKVIDINPTKHSVIMGRLHDKATGRMIGTVLRLAPEQPAAQPATATEGSPHNVATNVARIFGTGGSV